MASRVSVAIAVYNGARFLDEQLASLAAQQRLPDELVVADDGSSDDSLAIVKKFAATAPFPVVVLPPGGRLGYAQNFRRAVNACAGELIALCDQDDIWLPSKLALLERQFADPAALLAYHNAEIFGGRNDGPRYRKAEEEGGSADLRQAPFKVVCGLVQMFRADLRRFDDLWDLSLDHVNPGQRLAHDQWFFFLAHALGGVRYVDQMLVKYRHHGGNASLSGGPPGLFGRIALRFAHGGADDESYARCAASRAEVLRAMAAREPKLDLAPVAAFYDQLGKRYERRARSYLGRGPAARAAALAGSLAAGDYGRGPGRFDPRSVLRDLWSGVVRGRRGIAGNPPLR